MNIRALQIPIALCVSIALVSGAAAPSAQSLSQTAHAALPANPSDLWLVPAETDRAARASAQYRWLADGVAMFDAGDYAGALRALAAPALGDTALSGYAKYYTGLAHLKLSQTDSARQTFAALIDSRPAGHLAIAAALAAGQAAEAAGDAAAAVRFYAPLAANKLAVNDDVLNRWGRAAIAAGDRKQAAEAYARLYYEFPLTAAGAAAASQLEALKDYITRTGYDGDIGRAQMLFGARRYAESKAAFAAIRHALGGDDRELADLRIAECDYFQKQYAAARDGMRPYLQRASRLAEARYFYLSAIRELGDEDQYLALARALVADFPDSTWAEETLNNLGTHYILRSDDAAAAAAFKEQYAKFPTGQHAERAAWKYGWWSYRTGNHAEAIRVFESAAAAFPRSNYRPSFIYWAGRAHGKLGAAGERLARMRLVYADYGNSYYGRLAENHLRAAKALPSPDAVRHASSVKPAEPAPAIPNDQTIRQLLAAGLYDAAIDELRYAQRAWGASPPIDATIAWAYHQKGELRRAITLMRRAYPQHLTASGQELPDEILKVIFPLQYWTSIRRESALRGLDPYVVAALVAQESTFDAKVRSVANAWGLMQVIPSTGRRIARAVGIRNFTTAKLTDPEVNMRIGTYYFSRLVQQFGGTHYALASYNAGENRVIRWKAERPGLDEDEFIDDIPFPETQNYVKRILGTAEDYRMLYGERGVTPGVGGAPSTRKPAAASSTTKKPTTRKPATTKKPATKKPPAKTPTTKKKTTGKPPTP